MTCKIAALLGVLILAAVAAIALPRIECRPVYLLTEDGQKMLTEDGQALTTEQRQCRVVVSGKVKPNGFFDASPWLTLPAR